MRTDTSKQYPFSWQPLDGPTFDLQQPLFVRLNFYAFGPTPRICFFCEAQRLG